MWVPEDFLAWSHLTSHGLAASGLFPESENISIFLKSHHPSPSVKCHPHRFCDQENAAAALVLMSVLENVFFSVKILLTL